MTGAVITRLFTGAAILALTAACAPRPDAIPPVAAPPSAYSGLDCSQLQRQYLEENVKLASLSASQNSAATNDAWGVFLIGVPVSSLAGSDRQGEIASAKGQVALLKARFDAQCQAPGS